MKIISIKYKNYRCFNDITIKFNTTKKKNIHMVVAPNGGGKTEMLFSFQWVLYGFDFEKLNGKDDTPYSLNSTLYHALENGSAGDSRSCSVELVFEANDKIYTIKRTEKFTKKYRGNEVWSDGGTVELSFTDHNGVRSNPETDLELVEASLSKIIPKKILNGIIFDGERMKQLSQVTDESRGAVEGVISQITNEELFERCKTELGLLLKENSRAIKALGKKAGDEDDVEEIEDKIQETLQKIESYENTLDIDEVRIRELTARLDEIHKALEESKDTKNLEEERARLKNELSSKDKKLAILYDNLRDDLDDGYLLICDDVLNNVQKLLDKYDIPASLTVAAVRNILARETCICGAEWTPEHRQRLEDLLTQLPPDNVNSAIGEMVNHAKLDQEELKKTLGRTFKEIRNTEKEIKQIKEDISNISLRITEGATEQIKDLEEENIRKTKELGVLESEVQKIKEELPVLKRLVVQLRRDRNECGKFGEQLKVLADREEFINKCINAIKAVDEYNKMLSLKEINERLNQAYEMLSEDYDNGRRLYIVQYNKKTKYRMASYIEGKFNKIYKEDRETIAAFAAQPDILDPVDALKEYYICKVLESNSTGQAKINTLSFAKSILDFSRAERDVNSTELTRSYPFFIDSPFTELSDGNLEKSARRLHEFADQVILMISNESLSGVKDLIMPYVGGMTTLEKNNNDASSKIK